MSYFSVDSAFWMDSDVMDEFTPEDKYFYLYLLTNPHANVTGCFELSLKQASAELGYSKDTVERLIDRFINQHKVIDYDKDTKELLIIRWGKYHWTTSDKYTIALRRKIDGIKSLRFKAYLEAIFEDFQKYGIDTVWRPYADTMETSFSLSYTFPYPDSINNDIEKEENKKEEFHKYGEYGWVRLTDKQHEKLQKDLGDVELERCIRYVDESAQSNHNKNKWTDWNLVVRRCSREGWANNRGYGGKRSLTFMDLG